MFSVSFFTDKSFFLSSIVPQQNFNFDLQGVNNNLGDRLNNIEARLAATQQANMLDNANVQNQITKTIQEEVAKSANKTEELVNRAKMDIMKTANDSQLQLATQIKQEVEKSNSMLYSKLYENFSQQIEQKINQPITVLAQELRDQLSKNLANLTELSANEKAVLKQEVKAQIDNMTIQLTQKQAEKQAELSKVTADASLAFAGNTQALLETQAKVDQNSTMIAQLAQNLSSVTNQPQIAEQAMSQLMEEANRRIAAVADEKDKQLQLAMTASAHQLQLALSQAKQESEKSKSLEARIQELENPAPTPMDQSTQVAVQSSVNTALSNIQASTFVPMQVQTSKRKAEQAFTFQEPGTAVDRPIVKKFASTMPIKLIAASNEITARVLAGVAQSAGLPQQSQAANVTAQYAALQAGKPLSVSPGPPPKTMKWADVIAGKDENEIDSIRKAVGQSVDDVLFNKYINGTATETEIQSVERRISRTMEKYKKVDPSIPAEQKKGSDIDVEQDKRMAALQKVLNLSSENKQQIGNEYLYFRSNNLSGEPTYEMARAWFNQNFQDLRQGSSKVDLLKGLGNLQNFYDKDSLFHLRNKDNEKYEKIILQKTIVENMKAAGVIWGKVMSGNNETKAKLIEAAEAKFSSLSPEEESKQVLADEVGSFLRQIFDPEDDNVDQLVEGLTNLHEYLRYLGLSTGLIPWNFKSKEALTRPEHFEPTYKPSQSPILDTPRPVFSDEEEEKEEEAEIPEFGVQGQLPGSEEDSPFKEDKGKEHMTEEEEEEEERKRKKST